VLRSPHPEIVGAGSDGVPPRHVMVEAFRQLMARAATGELRVDTQRVPLAAIEDPGSAKTRAAADWSSSYNPNYARIEVRAGV